jgi:hypothetical protein
MYVWIIQLESRDSVVGIVTSYGTEDRGVGVQVPVVSRIFFSPHRPDRPWGSTQPPIQWVPGALSPGVKRPGREADQSLKARVEVKEMWIYASSPTYAFCCFILRTRVNFAIVLWAVKFAR